MKIKPLFDRVIAKPLKEESITKSGISLSSSQETSVKKAKVICTGTGIFEDGVFVEMYVKKDDIIYFEEHTTAKLSIDNSEFILIKQTDILAIEENI